MSTISFEDAENLKEGDLDGFFGGWPAPPSPAMSIEIVRAAHEAVIARDSEGGVVGFATAITDGTFAAYIPLVEVLPERQGEGIGSQLVTTLLERLNHCYMVDLVCDEEVAPFYERLGGIRLTAVAWRNRANLA